MGGGRDESARAREPARPGGKMGARRALALVAGLWLLSLIFSILSHLHLALGGWAVVWYVMLLAIEVVMLGQYMHRRTVTKTQTHTTAEKSML